MLTRARPRKSNSAEQDARWWENSGPRTLRSQSIGRAMFSGSLPIQACPQSGPRLNARISLPKKNTLPLNNNGMDVFANFGFPMPVFSPSQPATNIPLSLSPMAHFGSTTCFPELTNLKFMSATQTTREVFPLENQSLHSPKKSPLARLAPA